MTNLYDKTFTIINQLPASPDDPVKTEWVKNRLVGCDKADGLYDKSSSGMAYKANTWTAYIKDWQHYLPPLWLDGGYYALDDKTGFYTVNIGDLLIFADIDDPAPVSVQGFNALREKYKNCGGVVTACEAYINYRSDGAPWKTNHIEIIKG